MTSSIRLSPALATLLGFGLQVIIGGLAYLCVFFVAVGIAYVIQLCEHAGLVPSWLQNSGRYVEIVLHGADLVGLSLFIVSETIKFARQLWREFKEPVHG